MGSGEGDAGLEEANDWVKWLTRSEGIVTVNITFLVQWCVLTEFEPCLFCIQRQARQAQ